jgi:nucleotide-binding universal stress UspA family protein
MNARGSTEVIVATIGLSMGALSQNLFTMIVAMAVITTMAMPPMLRWGLSRVPLGKAERQRLEREEFEAKGFVTNLERLLLAVDESPTGKLASRLAGLIAAPRGMPITVLPLELSRSKKAPATVKTADVKKASPGSPAAETGSAGVVKAASEQQPRPKDKDEIPPEPVEVVVRIPDKPVEEAIRDEAKKGYDLLFIGIENTKKKGGGFDTDVTRVASSFEGPLALVVGNSTRLKHVEECPQRILVPVTGTEVSRRAAEVAIVLGRACKVPVTALYVSNRKSNGGGRARRSLRTRRQEQAILKEIVELADRYDFDIKTAVATDVAPDKAIVTAAKRGRHDLIVMGVSRRTGETLDFGDTAAAVLENADSSILFLAS